MVENGGSGKIAVSATGRGCSATGRPVPEKWGNGQNEGKGKGN